MPAASYERQLIAFHCDGHGWQVRALLFFPDHVPNTCPLLPAVEADEEAARAGADRVKGALAYVLRTPATLEIIQRHLTRAHEAGGAAAVLREFCEDAQGHFGLKHESRPTKARALRLVLAMDGATRQVDQMFTKPSRLARVAGSLAKSRAAAVALGATAMLLVTRHLCWRAQ